MNRERAIGMAGERFPLSGETVLEGVGLVDDHISIVNDSQGRLFVGLKSNLDLILVARRDLDGSWVANSDVLYGRFGTRPIFPEDSDGSCCAEWQG